MIMKRRNRPVLCNPARELRFFGRYPFREELNDANEGCQMSQKFKIFEKIINAIKDITTVIGRYHVDRTYLVVSLRSS